VAHIDPERLTLIAFGEPASAQESEHLESCRTCIASLAETRTVISVGRDAHQVRDLPAPPGDLWQRISEEAFAQPQELSPPKAKAQPKAWRSALVALAAVLIGIAGTLGVQSLRDKTPSIVAQASLGSKNVATRAAQGSATIIDTGHGLQMKLDVSGMPSTTGYYAVWLYDGADTMIALGTLGSAPLNLPSSASNLSRFSIVDISAQELGQQEHGVSMLQGALRQD
jgi:anti-sigma-K factor RskA